MDSIPFGESPQSETEPPVPIPIDDRRQLTVPDKYGVFLWWPETGHDWIHPEDVATCNAVLPSRRIFRKVVSDGEYSATLLYDQIKIRIKPVLWLEVEIDGYEVGDQIEVRSKLGQRKPFIATIRDMLWDRKARRIDYFMKAVDRNLADPYHYGDFQPAFDLSKPMTPRQRSLYEKQRFV